MKRIFSILSLMTAFVLLTSVAAFAQKVERIISLGPSLTQSIYYLNAQSQLVGCTSYCHAAKPDNKPIVSSAVKPNLEKIVSMKPDLVLASGLTSVKELETLRKMGIRVEVFKSPKTFDEICSQFIALGKLVGKEERAVAVIDSVKQRAEAIRLQNSNRNPKPRFFIQIGASPIFTVLPNTFMNDYITYCGGENIAQDLTAGTIGKELVIARKPDYIFVVTMGITGDEEKAMWSVFKNIPASKNDNIFILDSNIACQPTPITFIETLDLITNCINKK